MRMFTKTTKRRRDEFHQGDESQIPEDSVAYKVAVNVTQTGQKINLTKKLQEELEEAGKKKFRADAKQKETHAENRSIKRELSGAEKEIDDLKKEKEQLESTFK